MGERLLCKQEVIGSNPFTSTTVATELRHATGVAWATPKVPAFGEESQSRCGSAAALCCLKGKEGVVM